MTTQDEKVTSGHSTRHLIDLARSYARELSGPRATRVEDYMGTAFAVMADRLEELARIAGRWVGNDPTK